MQHHDGRWLTGTLPPPPFWPQVPLASGLSGEHVGDAGIIVDKYKLVVGDQDGGIGFWTGPLYPNGTANKPSKEAYGCGDGCLFDIQADPTGDGRAGPGWGLGGEEGEGGGDCSRQRGQHNAPLLSSQSTTTLRRSIRTLWQI